MSANAFIVAISRNLGEFLQMLEWTHTGRLHSQLESESCIQSESCLTDLISQISNSFVTMPKEIDDLAQRVVDYLDDYEKRLYSMNTVTTLIEDVYKNLAQILNCKFIAYTQVS